MTVRRTFPLLLVLMAGFVFGQSPKMLSFQGRVTNGRGETVDATGDLGIDVSSLLRKLTDAATVAPASDALRLPDGRDQTAAATCVGFWCDNGPHIYSNNPGNVGIGTQDPFATLHVEGDQLVTLWARNNGLSGVSLGLLGTVASPEGYAVVGVATADSGQNYGVAGFTSSPDGFAGYFQGRGYFSGDVGIGTMTPTDALDVDGNIHASGSLISGSSITIDGVNNRILSSFDLELHVVNGRALRLEPTPISPNLIGGYDSNRVTFNVVGATIGGGGRPTGVNEVTDDFGTVAGGWSNRAGSDDGDATAQAHATVGGGNNNTASGPSSTIGGGGVNTASGFGATVGGGGFNVAYAPDSTIGGGFRNAAGGGISTVGGGEGNSATALAATVGGGRDNSASGADATVGGGRNNRASRAYATVGGGLGNSASGADATVGGGLGNIAGAEFSTVPGGTRNIADGDHSFAAGRRAKANHDGAFVWADSNDNDFPSAAEPNFTPAANQFLARTTGGACFITAIDGTTGDSTAGVCVSSGGGSWSALSDRNAKENFEEVDTRELLQRLAATPVQTWNYKSQDPSIRHIGPTAQDFRAAFGVGEDERRITTIDADGVALAAIQGLHQLQNEKDARIAALEARLAALEDVVTRMSRRSHNNERAAR